jgi:hypothetical protein
MRTVIIIVVCFILGLGGYYGWWSSKASHFEAVTLANIDKLRADFAKQGNWMAFKYDGIDISGFPSAPAATLYKPCIHYNQPSARVMDLCTSQIVIQSENLDAQQFRITLPKRANGQEVYQNGLMHRYKIAASDTPEIVLRLPAAERAEGAPPAMLAGLNKTTPVATLDALPQDIAHQYGVRFPESITLRITQDDKARFSDFKIPSSPVILWRPLVYKLDGITDLFFHLMAEIAEKGKAQSNQPMSE